MFFKLTLRLVWLVGIYNAFFRYAPFDLLNLIQSGRVSAIPEKEKCTVTELVT